MIGAAAVLTVGCASSQNDYASYELYPVRQGSLIEMEYAPEATRFYLWAPTADEVRLMLFDEGEGGHAYKTLSMTQESDDGTWTVRVEGDLLGKFYTFNVKKDEKWLGDTPGINAKAVGVNFLGGGVRDASPRLLHCCIVRHSEQREIPGIDRRGNPLAGRTGHRH